MSSITLTPAQEKQLMAEAKAELVEALITRKHPIFKVGEEWDFLLECELCGILKINRRTLLTLKIPRYPVGTGNKIVYYRLSEAKAFIESLREK